MIFLIYTAHYNNKTLNLHTLLKFTFYKQIAKKTTLFLRNKLWITNKISFTKF